MVIAYISHHGRPNYEFGWFSRLGADKIKFLDTDFSQYPKKHAENIQYCKVNYQERAISRNRFHSTASLITYLDFEEYLEDVDVVIVLEIFSSLSKQFVKYCKSTGKKSVVLVYELIAKHPLHYLPTHILNRLYIRNNANQFVCVSNKARNSLIRLGINQRKIVVIYPGINVTLFAPINGSNKNDRKTHKNLGIIFVGGLKRHKGIDLFLNLADKLLPKYPELRFTVVGAGTYREIVETYENKYKTFHYLGKVPNNTLPNILNENDIYVLPCRDVHKYGIMITSEQFGFSLVEAMACGLVVITSDAGAIPEIVTDQNIICGQGNIDNIVDAVENIICNPHKLFEIKKRNINLARNRYNIDTQAKKLLDKITG